MSPRSSHTHTTAPQGNRTDQSFGKRVPASPKQNFCVGWTNSPSRSSITIDVV